MRCFIPSFPIGTVGASRCVVDCLHVERASFRRGNPPDVIAFLVRDARRNVMGYCWRLWWGRTSFYMKPRYAPLAGLKVSMHGPDSRHGLPGFKVDFDRTALPGARLAGGLAVAHSDTLPAWFPGRPLANGRAIHVARIRHPWVMFHRGVPSAPTPTVPKGDAVALVVRPPEQPHASPLGST